MHGLLRIALAPAIFLAAISPAAAQDWAPALEVDAEVALVSDYRFRGVTLSDNKPTLQAGIEVEHGGWFAGAWASTLRMDGSTSAEADFYVGKRGQIAGLDYSVSLYNYNFEDYPSYFEARATMARDLGPATVEIEFAYAPPQGEVDRANLYAGAKVEAPVGDSGLSLFARGGYEEAYYFGRKWDWEAGTSWSRGPFTLAASVAGVALIDPGPAEKTGLVFSATHAW
jgi:uncharacterized protein (TIGR02001 family)